MTDEAFEILRAGVLATVQDLGRWGYQRFGMPVSGAMDAFALQAGNLLVGNARGEASIEIAMGGLTLRAMRDTGVAICGADLWARLDGQAAPLWKSFAVHRGQELSWDRPASGVWAYLAVAGGIDVPAVMGSKSTYLRANVGGLCGRALRTGDILCRSSRLRRSGCSVGRSFTPADVPPCSNSIVARVVLGPQQDSFDPRAVETLCSAQYEVTPQSDRMGYRLKGPALGHKASADILSDALTFGSIQVPADGQPIVLMADRQTLGGYAKIATIISADLPAMAQLGPSGKVRFQPIDMDQAQQLAVRREQFLARLQVACGAENG